MNNSIAISDVMHVYGSFGMGLDYTVRLKLRLTDPVDEAILRRAADKTQKRYPYLSLRMRKNEESLYYEENPAPIAVLPTVDRVSLNGEQTNYHLWCVCYYEDQLCLDFYHGIADGTGMYMVLSTLLYYYCAERYGVTDHSGVRTLEDPILPEEWLDPEEQIPPMDLSRMQFPERKPTFSLLADGGMTPSDAKIWDVEIPEAAFVSFSSANDASPGTMVSVLFARALDTLYPDREKTIDFRYVVNARPMLHQEKTHHNCVGGVVFPFTDRVRNMPFSRQCTVHRGATFLQSDADHVIKALTVSANLFRMTLQRARTLEEKKQAFGQMMGGGAARNSFYVSYVGQWKLKALSPYIREFWTHVPAAGPLIAEIAAINGKIFLSVHQTFREDCVIKSFLRQLEEHGIPYVLREPAEIDNPRFLEPV